MRKVDVRCIEFILRFWPVLSTRGYLRVRIGADRRHRLRGVFPVNVLRLYLGDKKVFAFSQMISDHASESRLQDWIDVVEIERLICGTIVVRQAHLSL